MNAKTVVLCTGPESSGTRLLTRLVAHLGVVAIHRSVPHAKEWWSPPAGVDKVVSIVRDPYITQISAIEAGHPGHWNQGAEDFPWRITHAWHQMVNGIEAAGWPWLPLTFEGLVARPQGTYNYVADFIGVERQELPEPVKDPRP